MKKNKDTYLEPHCELIDIETVPAICSSIEAPDFGAGNGLDLD